MGPEPPDKREEKGENLGPTLVEKKQEVEGVVER